MAKPVLQAVRGMNDLFPEDTFSWQLLEEQFREVLACYDVGEIRVPLVEHTDLFARAIGDVTDIVQKEMYTFPDRNGESLTLRPEGTAGVVRALVEHGSLRGKTPRVYYMGPMFRHERPQKGRYRQFHQLGVEYLGMGQAAADAEIIALSARLLKSASVSADLQINSLGTPASRASYREILLAYLRPQAESLCADCQSRLERNPLRVLDCKVENCQQISTGAPRLSDHLDPESEQHFLQLQHLLDALQIPYTVNPALVRGLDYYHRTVFEWVTGALGSQGTVLAGGRYDGLVAQLGGPDTPAIGFALGMERLLALQALQNGMAPLPVPDLFMGALEEESVASLLQMAEDLRSRGVRTVTAGPAGFRALLRQAERSASRYQVLLGRSQLQGDTVLLKEQLGNRQWEGPWRDLPSGLAALGVDFPNA